MTDWLWMIFFLGFGTAMFFVGHYTGRLDADKCPTENAWINVRNHSADANKEITIHGINAEHEERMALIQRMALDGADIFEDEIQEDCDGQEDKKHD